MAKIQFDNWVLHNGEFLAAGTHQIPDEDVEAMRPYGKIIEEHAAVTPKKTSKKQTKAVLDDDPLG